MERNRSYKLTVELEEGAGAEVDEDVFVEEAGMLMTIFVIFPYFPNQLIEKISAPAVRGDDFELPAPGDARIRDRVQFARVFMQRELVEQTVAAFARLRVRIRAHRIDFDARGEPQNERGRAGGVQYLCAEILRGDVQDFRKFEAVIQKQPRLDVIA